MEKSLGDCVKDSVSHGVAEGVVHPLEIVQVQKQDGEVVSSCRQELGKPSLEDVPIRQARQGISPAWWRLFGNRNGTEQSNRNPVEGGPNEAPSDRSCPPVPMASPITAEIHFRLGPRNVTIFEKIGQNERCPLFPLIPEESLGRTVGPNDSTFPTIHEAQGVPGGLENLVHHLGRGKTA